MENKKMPKVLIMMMCKESAFSLERLLDNFDYLDYPRDRIRIVISYKYSGDNTLKILMDFFSKRNFEVEIYEDVYDMIGGPRYLGPLHEAMRLLINDEDYLVHIDDDIVDFPSDLLRELIRVDKDIVAPYIYRNTSNPLFYDTWVFRTLDGKMFSSHPPNKFSKEPFEVGSVGCLVCFKRKVFLEVPFERPPFNCLLSFCENAREKGYRIFALPYLRVYHTTAFRQRRPPSYIPKYPKVSRKDWKLLWSQKYFPMKIKIKKKIDWRKINCPENFRPCVNCGQCNYVTSSTCRKCGKHPKRDKWGKRY